MNDLSIMDNKAERRKFLGSLIVPLLIVALMWVVKIVEVSCGINLSRWGVTPHSLHGLVGIFTLPFLHANWEHLLSNSVPILVLDFASGLITWCIGNPDSTHIGASALVYGLNLFLITSGFIRGNRLLIVVSLIMVFLYGSFIWGMIPSLAIPQNISWEGHLSGAIIGVLLAVFLRKEGPQKEIHHWDEDDEDDSSDNEGNGEIPYWDVPTPSDEELTVRYRFRH